MKTITATILLSLGLAAGFATPAHAGSFAAQERIVSSDPNQGAQFAEVAIHNGVVHVVWVGYSVGNQGDIWYSRSTNLNGSAFTAPVNLSNNATPASGNDHPYVTAGPNGVYVGWNSDNNTGEVFVRRSVDGGQSFGGVQQLSNSGPHYSRITSLFTDPNGRVHVAWFDSSDTGGVGGAMIHVRSTCDGANWGADVAVTNQTIHGDVDNEEPRLSAVGSTLAITYRSSKRGDPQGGWAPYSIEMHTGSVNPGPCTTTWSYPSRRIAGGVPLSYGSAFRPEVFGDANGNVHMAWWDNTNGANVHYRKRTASGLFGPAAKVSSFDVDHLQPGALTSTPASQAGGLQMPPALVSNGTTAFIAYQFNQTVSASGLENGAIFLRESTDNGNTWGVQQLIQSNASVPRMALDGTGNNVGIVWTDIRGGQTARVYYRQYTLAATATGPSLTGSPTFAAQEVGTTSANRVFTLTSSGTAVTLQAPTVSKPDFNIVSTTCGGSLGIGASCTITANFSPKALGARSAELSVVTNAGDSPSSITLTGTGLRNSGGSAFSQNVNAVVFGYYETILGRVPDAGGANFWAGEATRVSGLGVDVREVFFAMSVQFFNSAEYQAKGRNNTEYVTDLYRTFFIREPDGPGLSFWLSQLNGGMDRGALLNNFLFSAEFSNQMTSIFGAASVRPEITLTIDLYRGILGVLPDSGGFNFWLGQIRNAQCQGQSAVTAQVANLGGLFVNSAEYAAREAARPAPDRIRMHVGDLYNGILRRGGDLDGYLFWVNQIQSGAQSRDQVRGQFTASPEFQVRANAVINAGCAL